jgi:dienelactone hydrolase
MNVPQWLKPGLVGAGVGAVALAIVGFSWGGWVTGSTAEAMASDRARLDVVGALVPFCVARSQADPEVTRITAELEGVSSYKRPDILMKAGWATMPGAAEADRDLAKACAVTLAAGW